MKPTLTIREAGLAVVVLGLVAPGLMSTLPGTRALAVRAQKDGAAQGKEDAPKVDRSQLKPAPADINDLSMQVAALRTLYLLKIGPEFASAHVQNFDHVRYVAKGCTQPPRKREEANASKEYVKALTELRNAFVVNNEDRINDLSEQLEELAKDDEPDLDDQVKITGQARKNAALFLAGYLEPNQLAVYIGAYGKDIPDPYFLIKNVIRADGKGKKQSPEQWKETRAFLVTEVGWLLGGLDPRAQARFGEQAARILDRSYELSNEQMKKEFARGGVGLRAELAKLCANRSMSVIQHVVERDLAELLSNPQLLPAVAAREDYLKKNPPATE